MLKVFDIRTYFYFWGSAFGLFPLLIIFLKRQDLRKEIILSGFLFSFIGVILEYIFFQDYWNPTLLIQFGKFGGVEDLMFGFVAGGFGAVFYNFLFKRKLVKGEKKRHWILPLMIFCQTLGIFLLTLVLKMNSIYGSAIGFLVPALVMFIVRKDLRMEIIISALLGGFILIGGEALILTSIGQDFLEKYFLLYRRVPILLGIFPITEFIWGFCFGALISPLYEFYSGKKMV